MANAKINQKEYLKKYLSNDDKKKKKKKLGLKKVKIIDDDVDLEKMRSIDDYEFEIFNATEDAPQIVGIVDERGPVDFSDKSRWKIIADDGQGDISIKERKTNQRDEDDGSPMRCLDPRSNKTKSEASEMQDKEKSVKEISNEVKLKSLKKHKSLKRERQDSDSDLSLHRKSSSPSSSEERSHSRKNRKTEKRKEKDEKPYNGDIDPLRSKKSKSRKRKNSSDSDSDSSLPRKSEEKSTRKNYSSDLSPPRKSRDGKPIKSNKNYDSDLRPPRKSKEKSSSKIYDSDFSPPRKSGNRKSKNNSKKYDSDLSPPRKSEGKSATKNYDSDLSPPRKSGNGKSKNNNKKYDSDLSPPRKSEGKSTRKNFRSDLSPPRKSRDGKSKRSNKNFDSDLSPLRTWREKSPPRRDSRNKYEMASNSLENRKNGAESDEDLSPPRICKNSESPIRSRKEDRRCDKRLKHIGYSVENQKNRRDFEKDSIATRNRKISQSPSRRLKKSRWNRESKSTSPEISKDRRMKKTLDGKTAGLQDAKALREETAAHKKREAEIFKKLSNEVSGAGSSVVIRDRKTGRRRDLRAEAAIEREKEERQREINEQYAKWGKGLKQMEDREEKLKDDLREMSKPLARYKDDEDLARMQRNKFHEDDPMLLFGKDKLIEQGVIKIGQKPGMSGPPNRYGIRPGKRWDGVDRSNGYEKKWFEAQNARKATSNEAYKWSTADM